LLSVVREVLRRTTAEKRAREAEITNHAHQRFGVLGKSLLEARPGMVNALTSLLGNADLILLSEEPMPAECREQVRTIRTMALRLNEMVQRLSSLESEMELNDRKSQVETREIRMVEAPES
jgi:transposase